MARCTQVAILIEEGAQMDKLNKKGLNAMHEAISGVCCGCCPLLYACCDYPAIRVLLSTAPPSALVSLLVCCSHTRRPAVLIASR